MVRLLPQAEQVITILSRPPDVSENSIFKSSPRFEGHFGQRHRYQIRRDFQHRFLPRPRRHEGDALHRRKREGAHSRRKRPLLL